MTTPSPTTPATVLARVSTEFDALARQLATTAAGLADLRGVLDQAAASVVAPAPQPAPIPRPAPPPYVAAPPPHVPVPPPYRPAHPPYRPAPAPNSAPPPYLVAPRPGLLKRAAAAADGKLVGSILAVAGVAVTLVGVVLLLVLAAQAGILRPEVRVAAGAALALALVGVGFRIHRRVENHLGAIAITATGFGAAYLDVVAVSAIYRWLPGPVSLLLGAAVAGAGMAIARRWDSQNLALLVLVPLIALAPVVAGGINVLLVGFMLALGAATVPVTMGTRWRGVHIVRAVATSGWLFVALIMSSRAFVDHVSHADRIALAIATLAAAVISISSMLQMLRRLPGDVTMVVASVLGCAPVLFSALAVGSGLAGALNLGLAAAVLVVVATASSWTGVDRTVARSLGVLSATAALIGTVSLLDGAIAISAMLALATTVLMVGGRDTTARAIGVTIGGLGLLGFASITPLAALTATTTIDRDSTLPIVLAGVMLIGLVVVGVRTRFDDTASTAQLVWAVGGLIGLYAATVVCVFTGVLIGGSQAGFLAGHMVATICWAAAGGVALFRATRVPAGNARMAPIGVGLALAAAAVAKLVLFDLATLDGAFRVGAFIVVGLLLLGLGARYARALA